MKYVIAMLVLFLTGFAMAADRPNVPAQLPDPDGKLGDATKPVQVYILAGQSNMVGMGNISGAKNVYDGVFLSSDPAVPDRPLQIYRVGTYRTSPLNVYLPDGTPTHKPVAEGRLEVPLPGSINCSADSAKALSASCISTAKKSTAATQAVNRSNKM